jgi:hypothetical protein
VLLKKGFTMPELIKLSNAKEFPASKLGDLLYSFPNSTEGGVCRSVIVGFTDENIPVICDEYCGGEVYPPHTATTSEFATVEEALRDAALSDIDYHEPHMKYATRVLEALAVNAPLDEFLTAIDLDG